MHDPTPTHSFESQSETRQSTHVPGFSLEWSVMDYVLSFFEKKERKSAFILIYAAFAVTFWAYLPYSERLFTLQEDGSVAMTQLIENGASLTTAERLWNLFQTSPQIWGAFLLFGLIPMGIVRFLFREKLSDYGLTLGLWRRTRNLILMTAPLFALTVWLAGPDPAYLQTYPYSPWLLGGFTSFTDGWPFLCAYFGIYLFFYYLSWEFFFRGFVQIGTESTVGYANAVLLGTLISTMAHFGPHAFLETLGAIAGGILWGFFVYRTRSIYAGWLTHATLGIMLDLILLNGFMPR